MQASRLPLQLDDFGANDATIFFEARIAAQRVRTASV